MLSRTCRRVQRLLPQAWTASWQSLRRRRRQVWEAGHPRHQGCQVCHASEERSSTAYGSPVATWLPGNSLQALSLQSF